MGVVGADVRMPFGEPWRVGKRPYGRAALSTAAACLKGFYLHQSSLGVNTELGGTLARTRLPTRADRGRSFLGHVKTEMPANPLAPKGPYRRHPKMLPDGARERAAGRGELGEGPADGDLAGRRGPADRGAVRPAPG